MSSPGAVDRASSRLSATSLARRLGPAGPSRGPAYRDLADRIRAAVLDGRLTVATGLPSERELATGLALSRTTVGAAYALLREQGWLDSRRGSGSRLRLPDGAGAPTAAVGVGAAGSAIFGYPAVGSDDIIDLTVASLPPPAEALRAAVVAATDDLMTHATTDGYHPYGLPELREVIADRYAAAGVPTTVEQILVTSGAQHAFSLCLGEFSAAGDRVLVECPTYPIALDAVRHHRRVPVPVGLAASCDIDPDPDGTTPGADQTWDMGVIGPALRHSTPRLAYLIPDFQNPTGAVMPPAIREELVAAARAAGTVLLVDESFRDISFPGSDPLPPPVAAVDRRRGDTVVSLGSVSKPLWGGLRTGWVRGTPAQVRRLAAARALGDMAGSVLDQLVATRLLRAPEVALAVQRARVAAGAQAVQAALARHLPSWRWTTPSGGTSLWVRLPEASALELAALAPAAGVRVVAGTRFGPDGTMGEHLRLPFTAGPDLLAEAVRRLAGVADQAAQRSRSSVPGWLA